MAYIDFNVNDIEEGVVYVSKKELMERTGASKSTVHLHIKNGKLDAFRFRNRTYFQPDIAESYEKIFKAGLM